MYASALPPGEGRAPSQQLQQLQQLFSQPGTQPSFSSFHSTAQGAAALSNAPQGSGGFLPGSAQGPEATHAVYGHASRTDQRSERGAGEDAALSAQEQLSKLQHLFAGAPAVGQNGQQSRGDWRDRGDGGSGEARRREEETGRMVVFIDYPAAAFSLVPEDVRNFLSVFGAVKQVSLSRKRAAAEVVMSPASAVEACVKELNETFLPGLGVLRVSALAPRGPPIEELLPASTADPAAPNLEGRRPEGEEPRRDSGREPQGEARKEEERRREARKRVCRLELVGLFAYEPEFDVTRAILGEHNGNISYIMDQTQHKVDLSIKGKAVNEAPVAERLHLSLSSNDAEAYDKALSMAEDLLQSVCEQFVSFCQSKHLPPPANATFRRHQYEQQTDGSLTYLGVAERAPVWLGASPANSSNRGGASPTPLASSPPPLAATPTAAIGAPAAMAAPTAMAAPGGLPGPSAAAAPGLLPGAGAQLAAGPVAGLPGPGSPSNGASGGLPAASLLAGPHLAPMPHPLPHPGGLPPGGQLAGLPLSAPLGHPAHVGLPTLAAPSPAAPALGHLPPGAAPGAPGGLLAHPHVSRPPLELAGPLGLPHPGVSHLGPPGSFLPGLAPHPFGVPAPGVLVPGLGDFAAAMEALAQGGRAPARREGRRSRSRERGRMVNIAAFHRSGEAAPVGGAPAAAGGGEVGAPGGATAAPEGEAA
uniref:KHDC4/BBP-like KH-domain type I domain-containing protein n=1 Tax=Toxoplasma gondii (strain ATCC 50861 / VEG) TaxID=432359 RepID=A0A0F7V225_TOXGV|nr:TPA: hypothetical protein BN1205_067310 [Toxoplasma gondii VEG]